MVGTRCGECGYMAEEDSSHLNPYKIVTAASFSEIPLCFKCYLRNYKRR